MDGRKTVTAHWDRISQSGGITSDTTNPSVGLPPNSRVIQLDASEDHTCAVTDSRIAVCWGRNDDGRADASEGTFTFVSAGAEHSCALTNNGEVHCSGSNAHRQSNAPRPPARYLAGPTAGYTTISTGERDTCAAHNTSSYALRSHNTTILHCWGESSNKLFSMLSSDGAGGSVGVGASHRCVLGSEGAVRCQGSNNVYGQSQGIDGCFVALTSGANHNCVRDRDVSGECWGRNRYGQTAVPTGFRFIDIAAGTSHTCGVNASNAIVCWGLDSSRQSDQPGGSNWMLVAAGGPHSCAVNQDGKVSCWGASGYGQLNVPAGIAASGVQQHVPSSDPPTASNASISSSSASGETSSSDSGLMTAEVLPGRIDARRLADGRIEFGYQPEGGDRLLPSSRFFPANAAVGRWLTSSNVLFEGILLGRINARKLTDGRIEFAFTTNSGKRVLPQSRYFPPGTRTSGWLRSNMIGFEG